MKWLQKLASKKLPQMDKRGEMQWVTVVVGIGISIVILAVLAIMLSSFQASQTANSLAYNITGSGLTFLDNATDQLGTAGTVVGVGLILVVMALIGFGAYAGYNRMRGR